jgi:2-oxoglutarate dehydrogenase complex dehydrogenase (E1) component-like enzyme
MAVSTAMETAVEWRHSGEVMLIAWCVTEEWGTTNSINRRLRNRFYKAVSQHPSTLADFEKRLIEEGTLTKEECATRFANSRWTVTKRILKRKRTCARNGLVN